MSRILQAAADARGINSPARRLSLPKVPAAVSAVVRVRPCLATESYGPKSLRILGDNSAVVENSEYVVDRVFPTDTSQEDFYSSTVQPLVASTIDGHNASVFAYGHTGSGKSHTMGFEKKGTGPDGVISRFLVDLVETVQAGANPQFKILVSCVEVGYPMSLEDLLRKASSSKLKLREGSCIRIDNLSKVKVVSASKADTQLRRACERRQTAPTARNGASSRSHCVFTVYLEAADKVHAKVSFVDLAGSEKGDERQTESSLINQSLFHLNRVITALSSPSDKVIVPWRDDLLTKVLRDELFGKSRIVFIACVSPAEEDANESKRSLDTINAVKQIKTQPIASVDGGPPRNGSLLEQVVQERDALRADRRQQSLSLLKETLQQLGTDIVHEDIPHTEFFVPMLREHLQLFYDGGGYEAELLAFLGDMTSLLHELI